MKKITQISTFVYVLSVCITIQAQQPITLSIEECQQKARDNYPLIKQYGLIERSKAYNLSNIIKAYLPQFVLNGQATYQSDVIGLPISLPGISIPSIDKDQYRATIDVSQSLWDGGVIRMRKKIAQAKKDVERQNLEINLYALQNQVNQLYFSILIVDEQLKRLDILEDDLQNSLEIIKTMLENGVSTLSEIDAVRVEILNLEQKRTELKSLRLIYSDMLSAMTGEEISNKTVFQKPTDLLVDPHSPINRPDIGLFEKQRIVLNAQKNMITAKNRPKIRLFAQGGYGKPGLNILSNEFDFFTLGGIKISWNFGGLYTKSNEKKLIAINKDKIDNQEEIFIFNARLEFSQAYNEILMAKALIQKDDEIIKLRHKVKIAAESKYKNGVYTINDLLKDIHAENRSKQDKIVHEIMYLMSIYNYKNIQGYNYDQSSQ